MLIGRVARTLRTTARSNIFGPSSSTSSLCVRRLAAAAASMSEVPDHHKELPACALPGSHKASDIVDKDEFGARWEIIWNAGLEPGQRFDIGNSAGALVNLLFRPAGSAADGSTGSSTSDIGLDVRGKRVVVPGCGRGYDVATFARAGAREAVGLELAPTAAASAEHYLQGALQKDPLPDGCTAHVVQADFFRHVPESSPPYDVGYDYTFGCAMHPSMRQDWAQQWARTIAQGGTLVTLIFPNDPDRDPDQGPPFVITPELFTSLLEPVGFTKLYSQPVPPEMSSAVRKGKEWLAVWRRQ